MKVLFIGTGYTPIPPAGYGGTERTISELMEALHRNGVDCELLNQVLPMSSKKFYAFERQLPRLLHGVRVGLGLDYDIVHCQTMRAGNVLGMAGIPYVYTTHNPAWHASSPYILPKIGFAFDEKQAVRMAQATVGMNAQTTAKARRVMFRRGPVVTIPLGVDTDRWTPNFPRGEPATALCVGVPSPRKRTHLAVAALMGTGVHLTVVGPIVPAYAWYVSFLRAMDPSVTILGEVSDGELMRQYDRASILVHPSCAESMPGVVLQAMAMGRPVISSAEVETTSVGLKFQEGDEDGMVKEIRDLVLAALSSDLVRMGRVARSCVETDYSTDVCARRYISLYQSVLAGDPPRLP